MLVYKLPQKFGYVHFATSGNSFYLGFFLFGAAQLYDVFAPASVDAAFFLGGIATGVGRGMGALPPSPQAGFRALCGPKAELW